MRTRYTITRKTTNMEKTPLTLKQRLSVIQRELDVPKTHYNQHGNFYYRNAEDILDAVKKLLIDGEFVRVDDEIVLVGDRYYVKATAWIQNENDALGTSAFAREADEQKGMQVSQLSGSTSSYARKYALNGLFAIDDVKDADSMDNTQKPIKSETVRVEGGTVSTAKTNVEVGPICEKHNVPFLKREGKFGPYYSHAEPTEPKGWCNKKASELEDPTESWTA